MAEMPSTTAASVTLLLERSRQAWITVGELIQKRKEILRTKDMRRKFTAPYNSQQVAAVRRIQAFWKGVKQRKLVKKFRRKELRILNIIGPDKVESAKVSNAVEMIAHSRHEQQRLNEANYQKQLIAIKEQLKLSEGPGIVNHMESQIRQWFLEYRDATGAFPDFPSVEDGGSASLFVNKNPQELALELDKLRLARETAEAEAAEAERLAAENKGKKGKGKGGKKDKDKKKDKKDDKKKDKKKDAKGKDAKKGKGKKGKNDEDPGWEPAIPQSSFLKDMNDSVIVFHDFWERRDDNLNIHQEFDVDIVKVQKREELKQEIRPEVDAALRRELDYLKVAIDGQKVKKAKKKKGKKKGKKGKKGKKEKDLTPNRTPESIFEELAMNNIIQQYAKRSFKEYWGNARVSGEALRQANYDFDIPFMPQAEELRNLLIHYSILSMSKNREKVPPIKSLVSWSTEEWKTCPPRCHFVPPWARRSLASIWSLLKMHIVAKA